MNSYRTLIAFALVALALVIGACATAEAPMAVKPVELNFGTYLDMGMPEQDVFVEAPGEPDKVCRVSPEEAEAFRDAPLFTVPTYVGQDPFQIGPEPIGPYDKGVALNMTLDEWLAGTGSGLYTVTGAESRIDLTFQNLAPDSAYSVRCGEIDYAQASIAYRPCGASDGLDNLFVTDAQGRAEVHLTTRFLPRSTAEKAQVLATVYHSSPQSTWPPRHDLGYNSHVHVIGAIPAADNQVWQDVSDGVAVAGSR